MKVSFPWKKRQANRESFFNAFYNASSILKIDHEDIQRFEQKCNNGTLTWKSEIYSILTGIAKGIEICAPNNNSAELELVEALLEKLAKVPSKDLLVREWILLIVTSLGAFIFSTSLLFAPLRFGIATFIVLSVSACLIGAWYGFKYKENYKNNLNKSAQRNSIVAGVFIAFALSVGTALLCSLAQLSVFSYTKWLAEKDRDLAISDPTLFPFIKNFLKDNYDLNLVLADEKQTWLYTYLSIDGLMGSPASIISTGDYCELFYSPRNLDYWSGIGYGELNKIFHQIVLAHEAAHCIGIATDYKNMRGDDPITQPINMSIFPDERHKVTGIDSFIEAHEYANTKRWREVISDLFAIGFAKKHYPDDADQIIREIVRIRSNAKHDVVHNSVCWLSYAKNKSPPADDKELYSWAVGLSMEPEHCKISTKNYRQTSPK